MRVSLSVSSTFPFRIEVGTSGQCVRLSPEASGSMLDNIVKAGKVLGPSRLSSRQLLGRSEVPEVVVVGKDQDLVSGALEVGAPLSEGFEDAQ
jgi:hypothetical protein